MGFSDFVSLLRTGFSRVSVGVLFRCPAYARQVWFVWEFGWLFVFVASLLATASPSGIELYFIQVYEIFIRIDLVDFWIAVF